MGHFACSTDRWHWAVRGWFTVFGEKVILCLCRNNVDLTYMYPRTVYVHPWRSLKNVTNVELHTNALFLPKGQTLRRLDLCFAVKRRGGGTDFSAVEYLWHKNTVSFRVEKITGTLETLFTQKKNIWICNMLPTLICNLREKKSRRNGLLVSVYANVHFLCS